MNAMDYLRVAPLINDCPNCGSSDIGDGAGKLEVLDNMIKRSCICGFSFEYDVNNGTMNKKKIKEAINQALELCRKQS